MKCEEVMKQNVHVVNQGDNVQTAARRLRDENIGFLPVIGEGGQVVGVVTDRDVAIRFAVEDRSPAACTVAEIMSTEVVSCRPSDDLAEAERQMALHRKSRILVTGPGGDLRGVISLSDVAVRDTATRAAVTMKKVSEREAGH